MCSKFLNLPYFKSSAIGICTSFLKNILFNLCKITILIYLTILKILPLQRWLKCVAFCIYTRHVLLNKFLLPGNFDAVGRQMAGD